MPRLPSGIFCCINTRPLDQLLHNVSSGQGLFIPDLMLIHQSDDLRPYMSLMWLLPLGADCEDNPGLNPLSAPVPPHLTMVDSGHRMNRLPDHLSERDRQTLNVFWRTPRCRAFLEQQMDKVRQLQNSGIISAAPEDRFIARWLQPQSAFAKGRKRTPLTEEVPEQAAVIPHRFTTPQQPSSSLTP